MARHELHGLGVAPGIAVGRVRFADSQGDDVAERHLRADQVEAGLALFEGARQRAIQALQRVQAATAQELGIQDAAIYGAQVAVLQDPAALNEIRQLIHEEQLAPESAIQRVVAKFGELFEALEGGDIKNWAADLRDPWHAVQRELALDWESDADDDGGEPVLLVADELAPSLLTRVPRERLAGLVCARGGRFSHGAVVARSFGIPTATGLDQVVQKAEAGELAVLYADAGHLLLGADDREAEAARRRSVERAAVRDRLLEEATEPAATRDGVPVAVRVNMESPRDLEIFDPAIVDGVGLFRTEFAYMERPTFPSVAEQSELYRGILERFPGKPVVFRTLDIGNDKRLRYFQMPPEANPALGWRGLRLSLKWRDLLLAQIQALIEAGAHGEVRIMLPMVTLPEEVREVRRLIEQVLPDGAPLPPLGCMIEVPAAALAIDELAAEVDFVSVGTNDLAQYLFAVDRDNPWVADLYRPYHPAHLRLLRHIGRVCGERDLPASVCGEMAGQFEGALFLVGAGFHDLSVASPFVAELKAVLRQCTRADLAGLAEAAAAAPSAEEAQEILREAAARAWEQVVEGIRKARR